MTISTGKVERTPCGVGKEQTAYSLVLGGTPCSVVQAATESILKMEAM